MASKWHDRPTSPETKPRMKLEAPWFQYLLPFDPKQVNKEVYDHVEFRALLRKHGGNRSSAARQRRNPDASGARVRSGSCTGATEVARTVTVGGGVQCP